MDTSTNAFDFVGTLLSLTYRAPNLSSADAVQHLSSLAAQIRRNTEEIPREHALNRKQISILKFVQQVSETLLDNLLAARPEVQQSDALADLSDALDELDNQIENHEIAQEIGPRVDAARATLAGLSA